MRHDIFRAHQQLFHRAAQSAFQQDRPPAFSERFQQHEVLHVSRANLQHVRVLRHERHVAVAHHFRHNREARRLLRLLQQLQPFFFHALEVVGRRPRLKRSATQQFRACLRHAFGCAHDLLFAFHRTRPRHHHKLISANFGAVHANPCFLFAKLFAHEFVRRRNARHRFHLRHRFHALQARCHVTEAHHADRNALFALNRVHFVAESLHLVCHFVYLLSRRSQFHRNNHRHSLSSRFCVPRYQLNRITRFPSLSFLLCVLCVLCVLSALCVNSLFFAPK